MAGERVIGVVAPSARTSSSTFPNNPPRTRSSLPTSKPALTPEQIRVHALGAVHAISASSPFKPLARSRSSSAVVAPIALQSPFISSDDDPLDKLPPKRGIDIYVEAAKANVPGNTSRWPSAFVSSLATLGEGSGSGSGTEPFSSSSEAGKAFRKSKKRRPKMHTKYNEEETGNPSFTSKQVRDFSQSSHGSSVSIRSATSLDESITGLPCFGRIGSGQADTVFGPALNPTRLTRTPTFERKDPIGSSM